jgi:hypothetical protein
MTTIATLIPSKAPNLPLAPQIYDRQTFDRFSNILRLYFNQIDNFSASLISDVGIGLLRSPYGAFEDTVSHSVTANTANAMTFNTTDYSSGVTLVGGSKITATYPGIYNLQFSTQFQNTDTQLHDVSIWLRINGVDVVGSTGYISVPNNHASVPGHSINGWNFFVQLNANDYVEIWWSTDSANVTIQAYAAGTSPTRPSTASNVATLTFVSALPA